MGGKKTPKPKKDTHVADDDAEAKAILGTKFLQDKSSQESEVTAREEEADDDDDDESPDPAFGKAMAEANAIVN